MVYFGHTAISDKGVPSLWNLQKYANPQQNTCLEYKKTTKHYLFLSLVCCDNVDTFYEHTLS